MIRRLLMRIFLAHRVSHKKCPLPVGRTCLEAQDLTLRALFSTHTVHAEQEQQLRGIKQKRA